MLRRIGCLGPHVVFLLVASASSLCAADPMPQPLAERPYFTLFAASIDRLLAACDVVFSSVERPDLFESMKDRLKRYRDFAGIEKTKPFGMLSTWDDVAPANVVFLPVNEINQLLKAATFDVVGFHQVSPDRYEIERPGSPYQVLVQKDYSFFADSVSTIRALRVTPDQLTRGLRDRYDLAVNLDLLQVPQPTKAKFVEGLRAQIEPWLQPQDDEASESANLRKSLGKLTLDLVERAAIDTKSLTIGVQLDPKSRLLSVEVVVEAVSKSRLATGLNSLASHRSDFSSLIQPNVPAGLALNLPLGGLVEQILGSTGDPPTKHSRLEAGLQLAGTGMGDLSLIAVLQGPDIAVLNDAIPQLIIKLEKSGQFSTVSENFDIHRGIVLHSLTPREMPSALTQWVGSDAEIVVGQGKQIVWMGIGQPSTLLDRLLEAIDLIDETSSTRTAGPLVRARFQARKLPELVASDLLIPNADPSATREAFSQGDDGFSLTIEPIRDGLKLRMEAEEGFIRLIGRDWISQIDGSKPP